MIKLMGTVRSTKISGTFVTKPRTESLHFPPSISKPPSLGFVVRKKTSAKAADTELGTAREYYKRCFFAPYTLAETHFNRREPVRVTATRLNTRSPRKRKRRREKAASLTSTRKLYPKVKPQEAFLISEISW